MTYTDKNIKVQINNYKVNIKDLKSYKHLNFGPGGSIPPPPKIPFTKYEAETNMALVRYVFTYTISIKDLQRKYGMHLGILNTVFTARSLCRGFWKQYLIIIIKNIVVTKLLSTVSLHNDNIFRLKTQVIRKFRASRYAYLEPKIVK